jgi:hypothetical protein
VTPLLWHNVVDLYWGSNCRGTDEVPVCHEQCFGLFEQPPEHELVSRTRDFTRCVCPCHDGFDPFTGERSERFD